jgi:carboxylesterase type B
MDERVRRLVTWIVLAAGGLTAGCHSDHHKKKATPTPTTTVTRTTTATPTPTSTAVSTATSTATPPATATSTATPPASSTPTATPTPQVSTATASATATATPDVECAIELDTGLGIICGTTATTAGVSSDAFLGMPYAEDTSGNNRWAAPVPVTSLPNKFQATHYGDICPQPASIIANPPPMAAAATLPPISEDCLSINVWTPSDRTAEERLPVMVYIHGGAFLFGSSASPEYDAAYLSTSQRVVVVSFNYRLGALAFMAGIAGLTGNYGILDQQLALQWVHDHVGDFGGDAQHITIFGESAGAMSVGLHLLSVPSSADLFDAALMESNPFALPYKSMTEAAKFSTDLAALFPCPPTDLACMRAVPWETVVAKQTDQSILLEGLLSGFSGLLLWAPVVDGTLITREPIDGAVADGLPKPTLLGTTRNEGTVFIYFALDVLKEETLTEAQYEGILQGLFGATTAAEIEVLYPPAPDSTQVASDMATDYMFFCASRFVAEQGDATTYTYQFDKVSNFNPFPTVPACATQVCHTAELPYVFNSAANLGFMFTPEEETLSRQMVGYWGSFAHPDHNPNTDGQPNWPSFPGKNYLLLDSPPTPAVDPPHNCDFWDTVGYGVISIDSPAE